MLDHALSAKKPATAVPAAAGRVRTANSRQHSPQQDSVSSILQQSRKNNNSEQQQQNPLAVVDTQAEKKKPQSAANDDPIVELPEQNAVEPEKIAEIKTLDFQGTADQALLAYTAATPSSMATSQPQLAVQLDSKLQQEAKTEAGSVPVLRAKNSGQDDLAMVAPEAVNNKSDFQPEDKLTGGESQTLVAQQQQNFAAAPDNHNNKKLLDKQQSNGFLSWFKTNFSGFLKRISTTDSGLNTSAGDRQKVNLEADADPQRANNTRSESDNALSQQRDLSINAYREHPGQSNIKAKAVDEQKTPALKTESTVNITQEKNQAMADYAAMPLPDNVRAKSDELLQPAISDNLADTRKQTIQATEVKKTDKKKEIIQAQQKTQQLNQQAEQEQRDIIVQNRSKVAQQQRRGIIEAAASVTEFNNNAAKKQTSLTSEVKGKVKQAEQSAEQKLIDGEAKAEDKRKEEERKAAAKKRELEKEQDNDSWWDRAVNAVKSAVKVISDAIDTIFTALREAVKFIIETAKKAAVALINSAREWIVNKLNTFRDWAKEQVNHYLKDSFPRLAKAINKGIDIVVDGAVKGVNAVADTLIKGVEALANALATALDKILSVFQGVLKAAVQIAGAVLTGDFAEALRIAVRAACDIAGIDPKPIFDFIDRAAGAVLKILKDPVAFFMNIVKGVGGGVKNFALNIKKHLINGLMGWLTGALSEVEITLPEKFDFKGVLGLGLQILGLTYENIKARVIKRFPAAEKVFGVVEKGLDIVRRIITEGPIAIWEMVKESLSNLKEIVLSGIRNFVVVTVIKEAVGWLLGMLNPAGAIVKVVKLLYDFTMFLVDRFQQIKGFILSIYGTITAIASGQLSKVMSAVEGAMAKSLPVVISLLASLAGLGGIGKTVQKIIGKVSKPVNKVIDKVIDKIISFVEKILGKGKKTKQENSKDKQADKKTGELGAIELADMNKAPVPAKRTKTEMKLHLQRVQQLLALVSKKAKNTDDIEHYFPKIKKRYRLQILKYDKAGNNKLGIHIKINPEATFTAFSDNMLVKANDGDIAVNSNNIVYGKETTLALSQGANKGSNKVATSMKAEYLDFEHPQGRDTRSTEQSNIFNLLATVGDGNARYIRGHLLNANLGGKPDDNNLFPITHQANVDHKIKVENEAKKRVNQEGFLIYYSVTVENMNDGEDGRFAYINADFNCELDTYKTVDGNIKRSNKEKKVRIKSRYKLNVKYKDKDIDTSSAIKRDDFDKDKVKLAANIKVKYLSEMTADELRAIPGIGSVSANRILTALSDGSIRSNKKLHEVIRTQEINKLRDAGFELRLYRA